MAGPVTILGSTGSVGTQTLDVVRSLGCEVFGLSANTGVRALLGQIREFHPKAVAVTDPAAAKKLKTALKGITGAPAVLSGKQGLLELAAMPGAPILLDAVMGVAGLEPALAAVESGKDLALANKESLVAGGPLISDAVKRCHVHLLPVDSEHSAVFQCLQDRASKPSLEKIILTASGGPFFGRSAKQLEQVTAADALKHPNWSMGPKITVDSATMMNKGFELIEAVRLFGVKPEAVQIVIQRQSIIHSMVQFSDHSVIAQLGVHDMRIPIQYALTWPKRVPGPAAELDFLSLKKLTFGIPDEKVFRCLAAAKEAIRLGGLVPAALNGANEAAVDLFLQGKISFLDIGRTAEAAVDRFSDVRGEFVLNDIFAVDADARRFVSALWKQRAEQA